MQPQWRVASRSWISMSTRDEGALRWTMVRGRKVTQLPASIMPSRVGRVDAVVCSKLRPCLANSSVRCLRSDR
ncbi:hypothetical protein D3C85_1836860 [compost metagenome]